MYRVLVNQTMCGHELGVSLHCGSRYSWYFVVPLLCLQEKRPLIQWKNNTPFVHSIIIQGLLFSWWFFSKQYPLPTALSYTVILAILPSLTSRSSFLLHSSMAQFSLAMASSYPVTTTPSFIYHLKKNHQGYITFGSNIYLFSLFYILHRSGMIFDNIPMKTKPYIGKEVTWDQGHSPRTY